MYTYGKHDEVVVILPDINGASPEAKNLTALFAQVYLLNRFGFITNGFKGWIYCHFN